MKDNKYDILRERQRKEFSTLPLHFAFGDEQINRKLEELNVKEDEINEKLVGIGAGGFMLNEDYSKYKEMTERHYKEMQDEINNDKDGTGFIRDMFFSELNNHEYGFTRDVGDTLRALGITTKQINSNKNLQKGLVLAMGEIEEFERRKEMKDEEELEP